MILSHQMRLRPNGSSQGARLLSSVLPVALVFCIVCSVVAPAFSQRQRGQGGQRDKQGNKGNLTQRIDRLVTDKVKELNIPGYSLVVIYKGDTVIQKGYGYADRERQIAAAPETVFGLASITKTFTALALLILVDEGRVHLNDTLDKYFDGLSPAYKRITINQLATMSSGVPVKNIGDREQLSWEQQLRRVQSTPLDFKSGTEFEYSNLAYRILGGVIEKASGKTYMAFLKERILNPLGMTQTLPTDQRFATPIAIPYDIDGRKIKRLDGYKDAQVNFAAGMLASNTVDMARYAQALLNRRFLTPAGYEHLWKTRLGLPDTKKNRKPSDWAFGWGSSNQQGHWKLGMNGGLPGVASSILIFPDDKLIVIGLANASGDAHQIAPLVAKEVLGINVSDEDDDEPGN